MFILPLRDERLDTDTEKLSLRKKDSLRAEGVRVILLIVPILNEADLDNKGIATFTLLLEAC